jgi:hypothetical protein
MRSFEEWLSNYRKDKNRADDDFYPNQVDVFKAGQESRQTEVDELQKRVDAVKQLIQVYKDEEKELELKEWEQSTIYGRIAIELEQALKGSHEQN